MRKVSGDEARSRHQSRCASFAHLSTGTGCFRSILEALNTPPPQHQTPQGTTSAMWYHICHCRDHDSVPKSHQPTAFVAPPTKSSKRSVGSSQSHRSAVKCRPPGTQRNLPTNPHKKYSTIAHLRVHAMWSVAEFPLPHGKVLPSHTATLHFYSFHACF